VVAVAFAGGLESPPASLPTSSPGVAAEASVSIAAPSFQPASGLTIREPSRSGVVITTLDLVVRGSRAGPAGPLRVTLESGEATLLADETIPASGAGGAFRVDLPLSDPRPGGSMVVQVETFTMHGAPLQVVRIPVTIGDLAHSTPRQVGRDGDGGLGEDGIIGGIVFGNAWDPEALGSRP
jgi:hypothetical protein